jgi:hypothetical protein
VRNCYSCLSIVTLLLLADDEEDGLSIASSQYPGQDMIDKAMDYLEDYSQMPFTEDHPWIQRFFGGNISSAPIEN